MVGRDRNKTYKFTPNLKIVNPQPPPLVRVNHLGHRREFSDPLKTTLPNMHRSHGLFRPLRTTFPRTQCAHTGSLPLPAPVIPGCCGLLAGRGAAWGCHPHRAQRRAGWGGNRCHTYKPGDTGGPPKHFPPPFSQQAGFVRGGNAPGALG